MSFVMKKLTRSTLTAFHFDLFVFENKLDSTDNKRTVHNTTCKTDKQSKRMRNYIKKKIDFDFIACLDFSFDYFLLCLL